MSKEPTTPEEELITQLSEAYLKDKRATKLRGYFEGWLAGWREAITTCLSAGIDPEVLAQTFEMSIEEVEKLRIHL